MSVYIQAAARIASGIAAVLQQKGACVIGMMGGRSVPELLEHLVPHCVGLNGQLYIFWIDERIAPEKNFVPALPYLEKMHKGGVAIHWYPITSMHRQQAEVELRQIEGRLHELGGAFDIVIASAGEDGHVASLFPDSSLLRAERTGYAFEEHAPKPPALRASVTPKLLLPVHEGFLFFINKQEALAKFRDQAVPAAACPAKLLLQRPLTIFTSP